MDTLPYQAEQHKKSFIEMFESLDEQYQEQALDEVAKNFENSINFDKLLGRFALSPTISNPNQRAENPQS
ncbi:hypothetical protein [Glaesserella sp.]|uniref:hypothetical protein n=1 Tax=Glaesserella sp. TaxID=2094731 RepID=UPI0035A0234F